MSEYLWKDGLPYELRDGELVNAGTLGPGAYRNHEGIWIDPSDPAFSTDQLPEQDEALPAIYLFSNARNGDGIAYAMAQDGTVLGSHWCSHWGYMRHDLHDRPDRKEACEAHYPGGYRLVVLMNPGEVPPPEVIERNRKQGEEAKAES
jgi:hypothetical protein